MRPIAIITLVCLAGLLAAAAARAEQPVVKTANRADELFAEGKAAAARKQWEESYRLFAQAWQHRQTYDIAGNFGQVALKLGKYAQAAELLDYCREHYPPTADADHRKAVEELFAEAVARVGQLRLEVTPREAEVWIDGRSRGLADALGPSVFVDPGAHEVRAKLSGHQSKTAVVDVAAGETRSVSVALTDEPAPPSPGVASAPNAAGQPMPGPSMPPAATADDSRTRPLWPVLVGGGLAVGAVAAWAGFTEASSSEADHARDLARQLTDPNACGSNTQQVARCREVRDAWKRADRYADYGTAGLVTAGVAAAATLTYWLWPGKPERAGSVRPGLLYAPAGGQLLLRGEF